MAKASKKELGKGINALLGGINKKSAPRKKAATVKELTNTVAVLPLEQIEVNPGQPRTEFDETALAELAESIKVHGLIQPVTVRRLSAKEYQLISGERRFRASKLAGKEDIPAYIRLADDQTLLEMALVENIQRENLNPIEIAFSLERLKKECSLTHEVLAERLGKKRSSISNYLRLINLPPMIQEAVKEEVISMGHGKILAGVEDPALQLILFNRTKSLNLSVRSLEKLLDSYSNPSGDKKSKDSGVPAEYKEVHNQINSFFGTKTKLKVDSDGKGQINIPFKNTKELNRILDLLDD